MRTDTEGIKFCKDCEYVRVLPADGEYLSKEYVCQHLEVSNEINLVTGEQRLKACVAARYNADAACGPDAKYFEPKGVVHWCKKLFRKE